MGRVLHCFVFCMVMHVGHVRWQHVTPSPELHDCMHRAQPHTYTLRHSHIDHTMPCDTSQFTIKITNIKTRVKVAGCTLGFLGQSLVTHQSQYSLSVRQDVSCDDDDQSCRISTALSLPYVLFYRLERRVGKLQNINIKVMTVMKYQIKMISLRSERQELCSAA